MENAAKTNNHSGLNSLFYPKTVVIIGASKNKVGGIKYFFSLKSSGFIADGGQVFLINPKLTELYGQPVYPNLDAEAIPKPVDLAIIAVPASAVPEVVRQCHKKVKSAVIFSSGFAESGEHDLDQDLRKAINSVDTLIIGPNGLGIINPYSKLTVFPEWPLYPGNISYIAQSGGTMARLYFFLGTLGIGFHNVISIGNAYGISPSQLIEYFSEDPKTKSIALYLESIPNGREFMEVAKKVSPKKPIVLWKGGQTDSGVKAAFSHTGGLAGMYDVWKGMCKQSGIMLAEYFEIFLDLTQVATIRPIAPKNLNVAIVVAGGGIGVEFTDNFEKEGLKVPRLSQETQNALAELFPGVNTNFKNPVDLGEYGYVPNMFAEAISIIIKDPNIGNLVFVREPERFPLLSQNLGIKDPMQLTLDTLLPIFKEHQKPVFCNPSQNAETEESFKLRHEFQLAMIKAGIPVINYMKNIPQIIQQLYNYGRFCEQNNK
jgi:acetyltransferase